MSKKLIEVTLPLEAINAEAAREKSIRHGHPSTLHLWWARRPLAAARAVIWSSLVDDPSAHPELYPTEETQNAERQRLFTILEKLVKWENSNDPEVLDAAKAEILRSTNNNPPALLDPFAGGGAIPLEAQRLGLEAHAHDLNPVAVMINKAMIEIPPRFAGQPPVNPDSCAKLDAAGGWQGAQGLAADVQYYGEWMKREAFRRIGHLYPKVKVPHELGGGEATVIAWIWARTVKCPNPACGCEMPLASTFVLSKKKGNEAWVKPIPEGNKIRFEVQSGKCPKEYESFKIGRSALFKCPCCGEVTTDAYVKQHGKAHELGCQLMAVVGEGKHGRIYLSPDAEQAVAANIPAPESYPSGVMPENPRWFSPPAFGMTEYSDLFTNRQLTALTTFSSLVAEAQAKAEADAVAAGVVNDHIALSAGGSGARAYGEAVGVYLAFVIDKMTDYNSSICSCKNNGSFHATTALRTIKAKSIMDISAGTWTIHFCCSFITTLRLLIGISRIRIAPLMCFFFTIFRNRNNGKKRVPLRFRKRFGILNAVINELTLLLHALRRANDRMVNLNDTLFDCGLKLFKVLHRVADIFCC